MLKFNPVKNGQAIVGGILLVVLLIGITVFIFFMIRRPEEATGPIPAAELLGPPADFTNQFKLEMQQTANDYPISSILPYGGPPDNQPFAIYPPTKEGKILIEIDDSVDFENAKGEALNWIEAQGYDPEDYEFIFKATAFPKQ